MSIIHVGTEVADDACMHTWVLALVANAVVALAYLAIAWIVATGLVSAGQWRSNPLAVATGLIFFSCGVGHGLHFVHLALDEHGSRAATDLHLAVWDVGTGVAAVWYFSLRGRFPALVRDPGRRSSPMRCADGGASPARLRGPMSHSSDALR